MLGRALPCIALATFPALALAGDSQSRIAPPPSAPQAPKTVEAPVIKTDAPVVERQRPAVVQQTPAKSTAPELRARADHFNQVYFSAPGDGAVWARGKSYKASFAADGTTYIPFLGSDAPQSYPLSMSVSSVTVGGQPIAFDAGVAPVQDGTTVSFRRGSFNEYYEMQLESVEQLFTFDSLPASGDLVVNIAMTSELAVRETPAGFVFANELGSVQYGKAITVDAAGVRTPALTTWNGESMQIFVSADVVGSATFPLTIDPVILTFNVDVTTLDNFAADVAFDAVTTSYYTVYEEVFNATDHDVYSERIDLTGTVLNGGYVDFTGSYWAEPAVASNGAVDQFLVVAAVGTPTGNTRIIRGSIVTPSPFAIGAQFDISSALQSGEKFAADVGGDPFGSAPSNWLVVWQRDFSATDQDVHGCLVASTGVPAATILINDTAGTIDTKPKVSKSNLAANWSIVWQRDFSATDGDIYGARINWNGAVTNASFTIDGSGTDHTNPNVSSPLESNSNYLVVAEEDFGTDHDIRAWDMNGTTIVDTENLSNINGGDFLEDQIQPSVDSDGRHFAVVYSESFAGSTTDYDIYVDDVHTSGDVVGIAEGHQNKAFSGSGEFLPSIASQRGGGTSSRNYMSVWQDAFAAGDTDIEGALYDSLNGGPVGTFCAGDGSGVACPCGNTGSAGHGCSNSVNASGALLSASGAASTTSDTLSLNGTLLPATATGLFFQGTVDVGGGAGAAFGDGKRCAGGTVIRMATKTAVGGAVSYPGGGDPSVSVKGAIPSAGATRFYQLWYRNAAAFCTPSTFNLTNGLSVVWTL